MASGKNYQIADSVVMSSIALPSITLNSGKIKTRLGIYNGVAYS
jgi:hypothetical protein